MTKSSEEYHDPSLPEFLCGGVDERVETESVCREQSMSDYSSGFCPSHGQWILAKPDPLKKKKKKKMPGWGQAVCCDGEGQSRIPSSKVSVKV
jgi:hypothetical protein